MHRLWLVCGFLLRSGNLLGDKGKALDRQGKPVCDAEIVGIKKTPIMDKTAVVTMKVPLEYVHAARFYRAEV